jgi:DNA-binding beta-propeller fold protein YncE
MQILSVVSKAAVWPKGGGDGIVSTHRSISIAICRAAAAMCLLAGVLAVAAAPALGVRGHVYQTSFGSEGTGPGQFSTPAGIAVNEATGVVYVADEGNKRVEWFTFDTGTKQYEYAGEFNGSGELLGEHGKKAGYGGLEDEEETGRFSQPGAIAVDNTCYRHGLEAGSSACEELDPSNGDVYVIDRTPRSDANEVVVDKFAAEGEYVGQITGKTASASPGFAVVEADFRGIGVGRDGEVWLLAGNKLGKSEVYVLELTSATIPFYAGKSVQLTSEGTVHVGGFVVDSQNHFFVSVYVGDVGIATDVVEFSEAGLILSERGVSVGNGGPRGIAVAVQGVAVEMPNPAVFGSSDDLYLSEVEESEAGLLENERVTRVTPEGETTRLPLETFGEGEFGCSTRFLLNCVAGLAVDSATGQVFTGVESSNSVRVYEPEPPAPPVLASESAVDVTDSGARLLGEVNPRSLPSEEATRYWFEYGPCTALGACATSGYGSRTSVGVLAGGFEVEAFGEAVVGLSAATVYHYHLVVENADGRAVGGERLLTTRTNGEFALADDRQWQLVSPPDKQGAQIEPLRGGSETDSGGDVQAAADGDGIAYVANAPTELGPAGYSNDVQVFSRRGAGGWQTRDLTVPHATYTNILIGNGQEYRFFSEDLSQVVVQPFGPFIPCANAKGETCLSPAASGQTAFVEDTGTGAFRPLETSCPAVGPCPEAVAEDANQPPGSVTYSPGENCGGANEPCGPHFVAATADLKHVLLGALSEWSAQAPPAEQIRPVNLLPPNGEGKVVAAGGFGTRFAGRPSAFSEDGSRVVWRGEVNGHRHLYERVNTTEPQSATAGERCTEPAKACTVQLDVGLEGEPVFQVASSDGSRVFFIELERGAEDLYEYDLGSESPRMLAAGVLGGVIGAGEDGSSVYFVSTAVLAGAKASPRGEAPQAGQPNLYVISGGAVRLVAVLSSGDAPDWSDTPEELTARVAPDGRWLAFMSQRGLTGYDNRDALSGQPDEEVFLYHAPADLAAQPGTLVCASCNPTGARPHGVVPFPEGSALTTADTSTPLSVGNDFMWQHTWLAGNVPGWTPIQIGVASYQSRYLSDRGRLFFNTSDALVPKDVNGQVDVYEYEPQGVGPAGGECGSAAVSGSEVFESETELSPGVVNPAGCVALISSGASTEESAFLDASEEGSDVFFLTSSRLVSRDTDNARDVYDAHECTEISPCLPEQASAPPPCSNEASCRPAPTPQPSIFAPSGSATFSGPGNVAPSPVLTTSGKVARKTVRCPRGKVRGKHKGCVKKPNAAKAKKSNRKGSKRRTK